MPVRLRPKRIPWVDSLAAFTCDHCCPTGFRFGGVYDYNGTRVVGRVPARVVGLHRNLLELLDHRRYLLHMSDSPDAIRWWGRHHVPNEGLTVSVGPFRLGLKRGAHEWVLTHAYRGSPADTQVSLGTGDLEQELAASPAPGTKDSQPPPSFEDLSVFDFRWPTAPTDATEAGDVIIRRAVLSNAGEHIDILPALADRSVVARPWTLLTLPAGERFTLWVGSPLWARLQLPRGTVLDEMPLLVPPETWFGPSTTDGELCYASRTRALGDVLQLRRPPNRALTRVTLVNDGGTPMKVDRIRLPVPKLALGWDEVNLRFVTDDVVLRRDRDGESATIELGKLPSDARLLSPARQTAKRSIREALHSLWT